MVEAKSYLEDLLGEIRQRLADQPITINLTVSDVLISGKDAVTIVVLINELVTNAIKHAFSDQRPGAIDVVCQYVLDRDRSIEIKVTDDGVGLGKTESPGGLGTKIVDGLVKSLSATLTTSLVKSDHPRPGTSVSILIPSRSLLS